MPPELKLAAVEKLTCTPPPVLEPPDPDLEAPELVVPLEGFELSVFEPGAAVLLDPLPHPTRIVAKHTAPPTIQSRTQNLSKATTVDRHRGTPMRLAMGFPPMQSSAGRIPRPA